MTHKEKESLLRKTASVGCNCCNNMTANLTIMCLLSQYLSWSRMLSSFEAEWYKKNCFDETYLVTNQPKTNCIHAADLFEQLIIAQLPKKSLPPYFLWNLKILYRFDKSSLLAVNQTKPVHTVLNLLLRFFVVLSSHVLYVFEVVP